MKNIINTILFIATIITISHSATYYVSPTGDDSNAGTREKPFATIQIAADKMEAGDICVLRGGIYEQAVRPKSLPLNSAPLTFKGENGETAIMTAAHPLTN